MPVVTNAGLGYLTSLIRLTSRPSTEPNYIAHGTGSTNADTVKTVTALDAEVDTAANGTSSQATTTVTNDTYRSVGTITAGATRAIVESGMRNQAATSGQTLVTRAVFSVINLATSDSIQYTWEIRLS